MRSEYAVDHDTEWMMRIVAITDTGEIVGAGDSPDGHEIQGYYDGYGRIVVFGLKSIPELDVSIDIPYGDDLRSLWDVWHLRCWEEADEPRTYTGGSPSSPDQGYFFE